jgi:sec-independent protein translocase protein TatA
MFGLSISHLFILLFVVLLFGGAKRLPELGGALGKGLRAFKKGLSGGDEDPRVEGPK